MTDVGGMEQRRHLRCTVYEPCTATVEGKEYSGAVVDMSVGGAAIRLEVQLDIQPDAGTPILLVIDGIGRLSTKVVRPLQDGVAVEFRIDPLKEKHLVAALERVLSDYPNDDY